MDVVSHVISCNQSKCIMSMNSATLQFVYDNGSRLNVICSYGPSIPSELLSTYAGTHNRGSLSMLSDAFLNVNKAYQCR